MNKAVTKLSGRTRPGRFALLTVGVLLWGAGLIGLPWWGVLDGPATRLIAFLATLAGMMCLFAGWGLLIVGDPFGVLQSARNTYSLSRLQMVLWTLVVLSAIMALAACRAWGQARGLSNGEVSTALNIDIPQDLFVVMGISFFSGAAAPAVLALKAQSDSTPGQVNAASRRMGADLDVQGQVVIRRSGKPRLVDVLRGDEVAIAGLIDLSKVQQLLITLILISVYFSMLAGMFSGDMLPTEVVEKSPTTPLPKFPRDFVTLLALSHGGYLAYKVSPKPAPGAPGSYPSTDSGPPPPPDWRAAGN